MCALLIAGVLSSRVARLLTRRFARAAFAKHKRSMTAPDLIEEIGTTFDAFCPAEPEEPVDVTFFGT